MAFAICMMGSFAFLFFYFRWLLFQVNQKYQQSVKHCWIQIRPDSLLGLILVQSVAKLSANKSPLVDIELD